MDQSDFTRGSGAGELLSQATRVALRRRAVPCRGQPCQKQPSTIVASRRSGNARSGSPGKGCCRRQPVISCGRRTIASRTSVLRFPRPRIRAITSDRFAFDRRSAIVWNSRRRRTRRKAALVLHAMRPHRTLSVGGLGRPHLVELPPHPGNVGRRCPPLTYQALEPPA